VVTKCHRYFFYIGDSMEKRTFYIHKSKDEPKSYTLLDKGYRLVTFIGGNKDILSIIKNLIKNECS
jgi:hypothetical protein